MTRAALLVILDALTRVGRMRPAEAEALLSAWDAGTLTEADVPVAPILATEALAFIVAALTAARRRIATVAARRFGYPVPVSVPQVLTVLRRVDALPMQARTRLIDAIRADDLRGALTREAQARTRVLFAARDVATFGPGAEGSAARSAGSVSRWQTAMRQAYAEDAATLARLGAGGELSAAQQARLVRAVAERAEYVDRFAVYLSRMASGDVPVRLSEKQIRTALVRQAGGRALFFQNAAEREAASLAYPVAFYRARDTPATCSRCLAAERAGPYLVSACPWPGGVCLGGDHCQCEIEIRDDAVEYARLTGVPLPSRAAVAA